MIDSARRRQKVLVRRVNGESMEEKREHIDQSQKKM